MDNYQYQNVDDVNDNMDWEHYTPENDDITNFLEGYAHSSPELGFTRLSSGIYQIDRLKSSTWVKTLKLRSRPTWHELLRHGRDFYTYVTTRDPGNCYTGQSRSCLVATLCFAHPHGWWLFQSTIPRGSWRKHLPEVGYRCATEWYYAAEPDSEAAMVPHAEDSVLFLCNYIMGSLVSQEGYDVPRLVVYGRKGGSASAPGRSNPCSGGSRVEPSCEEVGRRLGIRMLTEDVTIQQLEEEDSRPPPADTPPSGSGSATSSYSAGASTSYPAPSSTDFHAGGDSTHGYTTHHASGGSGSTRGQNRPLEPNSGKRDTTHHLAKSLSKLHVGDYDRRYQYDSGGHSNAFTPRTLPASQEIRQTHLGKSDARSQVVPLAKADPRDAAAPRARSTRRDLVVPTAKADSRAAAAPPARFDRQTIPAQLHRGTHQSKPLDVKPVRPRPDTVTCASREATPARTSTTVVAPAGGQGPIKHRRGVPNH